MSEEIRTSEVLGTEIADIQAQIDKANSVNNEEVVNQEIINQEPVKLAGKYENEEELKKGIKNLNTNLTEEEISSMDSKSLENHYLELQKNFSSKDIKIEDLNLQIEEKVIEKTEDKTEVKYQDVLNKLTSGTEVSEQEITMLEENGISKSFIETVINNNKTVEETKRNKTKLEIAQSIGGVEEYGNMINWAKENLSVEEVKIFNKLSKSENIEEAKFIVKNTYERYNSTKNTNVEKRIIEGQSNNNIINQNNQGYKDDKELFIAMDDPRYQLDRKYTAEVMRKMGLMS